jgi:hypothetical protein
MSRGQGRIIAVDGVNGPAIVKAARAAAATIPRAARAGVSLWDASGLFGDLMIAPPAAGSPSARTLVLVYAADLAFRIRWEIRPAVDEGKTVVAAPYIATVVAFGRAAGLDAAWMEDLLAFATRPDEALHVRARPSANAGGRSGFVEFGRECLEALSPAAAREIAPRTLAWMTDAARPPRRASAARRPARGR